MAEKVVWTIEWCIVNNWKWKKKNIYEKSFKKKLKWLWRPSKAKRFSEVLKEVLEENPCDAFIMSRNELIEICNSKLHEKDKISYATFDSWLMEKWKYQEEYYSFLRVWNYARSIQKRHYFKKMENENGFWSKYSWILERVFHDIFWRKDSVNSKTTETKDVKVTIDVDDRKKIDNLLTKANLWVWASSKTN